MSKDINQTVVFKTTPHEVYEALMSRRNTPPSAAARPRSAARSVVR
jgi:hypothetical protein